MIHASDLSAVVITKLYKPQCPSSTVVKDKESKSELKLLMPERSGLFAEEEKKDSRLAKAKVSIAKVQLVVRTGTRGGKCVAQVSDSRNFHFYGNRCKC